MSSIDDRIVSMDFQNSRFERGVEVTLNSLDKLKTALEFIGKKGSVDPAAANAGIDQMGKSVGGVSAKFIALSTIAITALSNITNKAINAGTAFAKSFTIGPIIDGLHEYETNLKSIQTIQANTDRPLPEINKALAQLNAYSDQTIYNFSEMAKNIGTFTAAGVDLKTSVSSIKGIANLAALSGSSSEQAATAMYQLSQAISSGRVGLQDWNSVVNAGMGGKKLQTALASTAQAMGKLGKDAVGTTGKMKTLAINGKSFRESISSKPGQAAWLTSDVLVNTLATLDGRFSKAALSVQKNADGTLKYNKATAQAAINDARLALEKKNGVKYTDAQFKSLMKLSDSAFKSATEVKTLGQVFDVAKETIGSGWSASFQSIFGNLTESKKLFTSMSGTINDFINANALARNNVLAAWKKGGGRIALIEGLKAGFGAIGAILRSVQEAFRNVFPQKTGQDLINMSTRFKEVMEGLKPSQETLNNITSIFRGLFSTMHIGWMIVKGLFGVVGDLFGSIKSNSGGLVSMLASFGDWIYALDLAIEKGENLDKFFNGLSGILTKPIELIGKFGSALRDAFENMHMPDLSAIGKAFGGVGQAIGNALSGGNIEAASAGLGAGFLGGLFLMVRKFFKSLDRLASGRGLGSIKAIFQSLTGSLRAMQTQIQAKTLLLIAGAVGVLTLSILTLSTIDPAKLGIAMGALTLAFAQLLAAMAIMTKVIGTGAYKQMPFITYSLLLLATAMVAVAVAAKIFATMNWEEMAKGLGGVAGGLLIITGAMRLIPTKGMLRQSIGLLAIGLALNAIAIAVKVFATMDLVTMGKGMLAMAGALTVIGLAMRLMPKSMFITGPALVAVGAALVLISGALKVMGGMSWDAIGKGMATLAGTLILLAVGLNAMLTALPGAAALLVAAGALAILTPSLVILGTLSWQSIGKGMAVLAASFTILGLAGLLLTPIIPAILGLAAALALLAVGIALIGAGVLAFSAGMAALAASGAAGVTVLTAMLTAVINLIPVAMKKIAEGIVAFVTTIAEGTPKLVAAMNKTVLAMINGLIKIIPRFGVLLRVMITTGLGVIASMAPRFVSTGFKILMSFLNGIRSNIGRIVTTAAQIVINFINGIAKKMPGIVNAGFNLLISFIRGVRKAVRERGDELVTEGGKLAAEIVKGMVKGIENGAKAIGNAAKNAAKAALNKAKDFLGIGGPSKEFEELGGWSSKGLADGIISGERVINSAANQVGKSAVQNMKKAVSGLGATLDGEMDVRPTIAPVIDMTAIHKGASQIGSVLDKNAIAAEVSTSQALTISTDRLNIEESKSTSDDKPAPTEFKFEQNNYSPKALTAAEIYRNTRNQISLAKEALSS